MDNNLISDFLEKLKNERKSEATIAYYKSLIKDFLDFCSFTGGKPNKETAQKFLFVKSSSLDRKDSTIRTYFFVLRSFLDSIKEKNDIDFKLPPVRVNPPAFFDIKEIMLMLKRSEYAPVHNTFLRTMVATLARRNEVLGLRGQNLRIHEEDGQKYYIIDFPIEIVKTEPRDVVVDEVTFKKLKEISSEPEKKIFNFSIRTATNIILRNKSKGIRGSCHAIRHGVARFIASRIKYQSDRDVLRYYMGHKLMVRDISDRYSVIGVLRLWEFYRDYSPLMVFSY